MKTLLTILIFSLSLVSCEQEETKYLLIGELTSLRLDDDGEYHFSTDNRTFHDIYNNNIHISRGGDSPKLYSKHFRCPKGYCGRGIVEWTEEYQDYQIIIPVNFKIETFED